MLNHFYNAYVTEADSFVSNVKITPGNKKKFCSINTA